MNKNIEHIVQSFKRFARGGSIRDLISEYKFHQLNRLDKLNDSMFDLPDAKGLKKEFLKRHGKEHLFYVGKGIDVPIGEKYKRTEYPVFMDREQIGTILKVTGPGFDNVVYEGRIKGYVNRCIEFGNKRRLSDEPKEDVSRVILQRTDGHRRDGHYQLKFA